MGRRRGHCPLENGGAARTQVQHHEDETSGGATGLLGPASLGDAGSWTQRNERDLTDVEQSGLPDRFRSAPPTRPGRRPRSRPTRTATYRGDLHILVEAPRLAALTATHLARSFAAAEYRHTARITVAPAETVRARLPVPLHWSIDIRSPDACAIRLGADSPDPVTRHIAEIAALGADFTLDADAVIVDRVHALGHRLLRPDRPTTRLARRSEKFRMAA